MRYSLVIAFAAFMFAGNIAGNMEMANAHGVCAMMSCTPSCAPFTIIKECGVPKPFFGNYYQVITTAVIISSILLAAFYYFRNYYLQRRDFYIVR